MLRYSTFLYIFIKNDRYFSLLTINIIKVLNNNLHPQRYRLLEVPGIPNDEWYTSFGSSKGMQTQGRLFAFHLPKADTGPLKVEIYFMYFDDTRCH